MLPIDAPEVVERVQKGLALVDRIAAQVYRSLGGRVEQEELVSAGREGLVEAAQRYEPERGNSFESYAHVRIRGAMWDTARRMGGLPRRTYERGVALEAASKAAESGLDSSSVTAPGASADTQRVIVDRLATFATASIIALVAHDQRERAASANPEAALEHAQLLDVIHRGMDGLAADDSDLVRRRFVDGESIEDIARSMNITGSWAGRLLAQAVARLKRAVHKRL